MGFPNLRNIGKATVTWKKAHLKKGVQSWVTNGGTAGTAGMGTHVFSIFRIICLGVATAVITHTGMSRVESFLHVCHGVQKGVLFGRIFCTTATNFLSPDDTLVADAASPVQVSLVRWPKLVNVETSAGHVKHKAMLWYLRTEYEEWNLDLLDYNNCNGWFTIDLEICLQFHDVSGMVVDLGLGKIVSLTQTVSRSLKSPERNHHDWAWTETWSWVPSSQMFDQTKHLTINDLW